MTVLAMATDGQNLFFTWGEEMLNLWTMEVSSD